MYDGALPPTHGPRVGRWMERSLVHGEGDAFGTPWRLVQFQQYILNRVYEYDPATGRRLYDRVLIGMAKGNAKTELVAGIGLNELGGPTAPVSPNVPVAAASRENANKLFGAARTMVEEGPLKRFFDTQAYQILRLDGPGVMQRIAAVASTNDGGLPTAELEDELHEWEGEEVVRVHLVQGGSLKKRRAIRPDGVAFGTVQIGISTAGDSKQSLLGTLYDHGVKVATGEIEDPGFLFLWWEADDHWDLDDPEQLLRALHQANPALGTFLTVETLLERFGNPLLARHEFARYHLNRWVDDPDRWIGETLLRSRTMLDDQKRPVGWPPAGTPIVLAFDGSYNRDCTALHGCTLDGHLFLVRVWEPGGEPVPRDEVDAEVKAAFDRWQVVEFAVDPPGWNTEIEAWEREFGTRGLAEVRGHEIMRGSGAVLRFETNQPARMGPACARFRAAVEAGTLTHDGHPTFIRHVTNCHTRDTRYGSVIAKDHKDSPRKIDDAVAAVVAFERATHQPKARRRAAFAGGF